MDVLITHVYDKERFAHYVRLKFRIRKATALKLPNDINEGCHLKLTGIPECDVLYIQRPNIELGRYFAANHGKICSLKIINNMTVARKPTIPPYCDNERKSFEQKVEDMYNGSHVYSVTYTELVKRESTMTKQEIDKLLVNPCVKSINIIMK